MKNLARYLDNPFDDTSIGLARVVAFATDHLQRMIGNNAGGELSERITATSSALGALAEEATDDLTQLGIRKARKQSKDAFRASIPGTVARIMAAVVAEYGPDAAEVVQCCPFGRSVFGSCRDDEVTGHLQTLINGVTSLEATLGAAWVTKATALKTAWVELYEASEAATGAKTTSEKGRQQAREHLQLMLFLNLAKLMMLFPREPEKLQLYMQQSLLDLPGRKGGKPVSPISHEGEESEEG